jgi:hypothetical protein
MLLETAGQTKANFILSEFDEIEYLQLLYMKSMTVCLILFLFSLYDLLCISGRELRKMSSENSTENNKFFSNMCDGSSKNYKPTDL